MAPVYTIYNLSSDTLSISRPARRSPLTIADLAPNSHTQVQLPSWTKLTLSIPLTQVSTKPKANDEKSRELAEHVFFRLRRGTCMKSWKQVELPPETRWQMYNMKTSPKERTLCIIPNRELCSFLSEIPDGVPLSACLLPGTHESMSRYGWPFSQCQSVSLARQLASGVRVIDVRLSVVNSVLISYHGICLERTPFLDILTTVHTFLTTPASSLETVIMSIKQENATVNPTVFSELVKSEIAKAPGGVGMWYLQNRIPALGEVRGKIVMFSRFGLDGDTWDGGFVGLGLHPNLWPDSRKEGFIWNCKDTVVRIHDWYGIPSFLSIPEKFTLSTQTFAPLTNDPSYPNVPFVFFSAGNVPWALPQTVALGAPGIDGINVRLGKWLLERLADDDPGKDQVKKRIRGWPMMDFCDVRVMRMFIECNFMWRKNREEGWV